MHAGDLVVQPAAVGIRQLPYRARRADAGAKRHQHRARRCAGGVRRGRLRAGADHLRARGLGRPVVAAGLEPIDGRGDGGDRGRGRQRHSRCVLLDARRHGRRRRTRSRRLPAGRDAQAGRAGRAHRHLARPARHPDRAHVAPDRRPGDLPHLSPRGLRVHRRARGACVAPAGHRQTCETDDRPRHDPGPGARRRADHQDRLLRLAGPRGAPARTRGDGDVGRHHDRQPVHRRARTVLPGHRGHRQRRRPRPGRGLAAGAGVLAAAPSHRHARFPGR